jgi:hypothetical protein
MSQQVGNFEQRRYARQFLLGPESAAAPRELSGAASWSKAAMLRTHSWLRVERAAAEGRELVCLGHVFDPAAPALGNTALVQALCDRSATFGEFEKASAALGGRWVALLRIGADARLYPDAAGLRSVFHARLDNGAVVAASQPELLSHAYGLRRDAGLDRAFRGHEHFASSWPCELTPYPGVRQLLPNHFLDLNTGEVRRFWPTAAASEIDIDIAVETIAAQLNGFVAAALNRGSAAMAMTGGYDSRTLFAAAGAARKMLTPFRVTGAHFPWYDTAIPRKLVRRFGGSLLEAAPRPASAEVRRLVRENVADLWYDPGEYILSAFDLPTSDFVLFGWLSEIARCFYYPDGSHPDKVDGAVLAEVSYFRGHPMATAEFERWLAGVPAGTGHAVLDLFYWEHRAGNWASLLAAACDAFCEPLAPYNCRALLQAALAVPVSFRRAPYELHRRICHHAMPGALDIPFNFSWRDTLRERALGVLPWRVRQWLQRSAATPAA